MAKRIYIAATRQNDGKTTVALGLIADLIARGLRVAYMKPVGQRVVKAGDAVVDEDVLLVREIYQTRGTLQDCSPIGIPSGFTEKYIRGEITSDLPERIERAFARIAGDCDVVILEGTGHAGVGSVIDLSNARVAGLLASDVLIVTVGGIGRPYDEVALNSALFRQAGVKVVGVVANKVLPSKLSRISDTLGVALQRLELELLGVIPDVDILSGPTVAQLIEDGEATLLSGADDLTGAASSVVVGTSKAEFVLSQIGEASMLVTSGDREDLVRAALEFWRSARSDKRLVAVVLTDGLVPGEKTLAAAREVRLPVLSVKSSCYETARLIGDLLVKIRPSDREKIGIVRSLIRENVDVPRILNKIGL